MAQLLVAGIEIFIVPSSIFPSGWLVFMLLTVFTLAKSIIFIFLESFPVSWAVH